MFKSIAAFTFSLMVGLIAFDQLTYAGNGVIHFTGSIVEPACVIDVDASKATSLSTVDNAISVNGCGTVQKENMTTSWADAHLAESREYKNVNGTAFYVVTYR